MNDLPDKWGNNYPSADECYVTVSRTANSNGLLAIDYLKEVFLPEVGAVAGELENASALLLDAFSGHHKQVVKNFTASHDLLKWLMMYGGIAPVSQLLDLLVNKVCRGFFWDEFEAWSLVAPVNEKTGHPYAPSR